MPTLLIFVNYVVTMFLGLAILSGAVAPWAVVVLPLAIYGQFRVWRSVEPAPTSPRLT